MKKIILLGSVVLVSVHGSNKTVETLTNVPPESIVIKEVYEYTSSKTVMDKLKLCLGGSWKPPTSETAIYSVGTVVTPDLQLTVDIAVLNAKTTLADRINGKVRSQTKSFIAKIGYSRSNGHFYSFRSRKGNKKYHCRCRCCGYKVSESSVVVNSTQYRGYVLLEYSDKRRRIKLL